MAIAGTSLHHWREGQISLSTGKIALWLLETCLWRVAETSEASCSPASTLRCCSYTTLSSLNSTVHLVPSVMVTVPVPSFLAFLQCPSHLPLGQVHVQLPLIDPSSLHSRSTMQPLLA